MYRKYANKKTLAHGKLFASKKEAKRYGELMLLQRAGEILNLETQPVIACQVNGAHVCNYIADFRYLERAGRTIVEDVKGYKTDVYRLKRKLVKACTGIEIQEV